MFSKFTEEGKKVLTNMQKEMAELRHPYIGTEHLFLSILKYGENEIKNILEDYGLTYSVFKQELISIVGYGSKTSEFYLYTPLLRTVIENAMLESGDKDKLSVDTEDLLRALLEEKEGIAIRIMLSLDVDIESLLEEFSSDIPKVVKNEKLLINKFGINLNDEAKNNKIDPVIGREKEIKKVIEILSRRNKNNPILIGDAGVGKTAIVEEVANQIQLGLVPKNLLNKKIMSVSMASLVAGTKYRGEFEDRIGKIIEELECNENIILFIDEVHTLVGAGGAEGAIDASNILKPALARGKIKIIGATTTEEYKETIERDKALSRRFQKIEVREPDKETCLDILKKISPLYESYHKVNVSEKNLRLIVDLSDKYIHNRKMPDKAIDILDEVCCKVAIENLKKDNSSIMQDALKKVVEAKNKCIIENNFKEAFNLKQEEMRIQSKIDKLTSKDKEKYKKVTDLDIKKIVEEKTNVPIVSINKKLLTEENCNIIGQNNILNEVNRAIKKIKLGYKRKAKPYSFLFVGPTGVGKTALAKEISKNMFNEEIIRLDMSEYKEEHSISKIIGAPPGYVGYEDKNNVFEKVKDNPYSIILLDEIEKASKNIINLFLQVLDEGVAKNSCGEEIFFDNTIIIITSNISYNKNSIGFNGNDNEKREEAIKDILGIEFLNRIDKVLFFNYLKEEDVIKIINLKLKNIKNMYKKENIKLFFNKNIIDEIVKMSSYKKFGARKIDKIIDTYIDSFIVDQIMIGKDIIRLNHLDMEVV